MRFTLSVLVLLSFFAIPAAARADTLFTISIEGQNAVTYTLPDTPDGVYGQYFVYSGLSNLSGTLYVFDPAFASFPAGHQNLEIWNGVTDYVFAGSQLYSGTLDNPVFVPGTFSLVSRDAGGPSAVLMVDGGAGSPVPEPTSLALLGTGIVGMFGVARRRFKA